MPSFSVSPFGGCKQSSFGRGLKAGGPNYLLQFMHAHEKSAKIDSYAHYWKNYFSLDHDPSARLGQKNILRYVPQPLTICMQKADKSEDISRVYKAAALCGTEIEICPLEKISDPLKHTRVRFLSEPPPAPLQSLANRGISFHTAPVLSNGRLELLHYLRELSLSIDTHRYGYIAH